MDDTMNDVTKLNEQEFRKSFFEVLGSKNLTEITEWVTAIQPNEQTTLSLAQQLEQWQSNPTTEGRIQLLARSLYEQVNYGTIYEWSLFQNLYAIRILLEDSKGEMEEVQFSCLMEWVLRLEEIIWDDIRFVWIPNPYEYTFIFRRHNWELGSVFSRALEAKPNDCAQMFWSDIFQLADAMTKVKGARVDGTLVPDCQAVLLAYQQC
jgi:hypothetical protein